MDVYLVPIGQDRYELYCEVPDEPEPAPEEEPPGFFRRLKQRFSAMLAEAERERRRTHADQPPRGAFGRMKSRTLRYVAESIAEQRLLCVANSAGMKLLVIETQQGVVVR